MTIFIRGKRKWYRKIRERKREEGETGVYELQPFSANKILINLLDG